jgi:Peptidase A4 family/IPT/TIG domain
MLRFAAFAVLTTAGCTVLAGPVGARPGPEVAARVGTAVAPAAPGGTVPRLARRMTGLAPIGQRLPHGHPLDPVGGQRPHDAASGVLLSDNWSGYIDLGETGPLSAVHGSWVVPTVQTSTDDEASATWIGIDGVASESLLQTGTAQLSGPDAGASPYYAWVELLPDTPLVIDQPAGSTAPVAPGDAMSAEIQETGLNEWTVALDDVTQGWTFSQPFAYTTPGLTAEWIEEAPTAHGAVETLAHYGSTTFTNVGTNSGSPSSLGAFPVAITGATGAVVSYPSAFDSSTDSFSVSYGSPPPVVNDVSPAEGISSGGTMVNIDGDYVAGVTAVDFSGVSVPFTTDAFDGGVIAAAPPHPAGTVDITVTTPGGTSQLSGDDQYTYFDPAPTTLPSPASGPHHGYWLVGSDGGIFSFGSAPFYGSTGSLHLQRPVVGIVPTPDRGGYWLAASDGGVFAFGDAGFYGSIPGLGLHPAGSGLPHALDAPIVGLVPSSDGGGYFMVAADGGVFAFGDAQFSGSCPGRGGCAGAGVAVMPDASGNGYWLVTQSGRVYTFGDAPDEGAPGPHGDPVTSAVRTPDGGGYWILFADGALSNFGDAPNFGSPSGLLGGLDPAAAVVPTSDGGGYWIAAANGGITGFGDAPDDGSMLGVHLNGSIVAAAGW